VWDIGDNTHGTINDVTTRSKMSSILTPPPKKAPSTPNTSAQRRTASTQFVSTLHKIRVDKKAKVLAAGSEARSADRNAASTKVEDDDYKAIINKWNNSYRGNDRIKVGIRVFIYAFDGPKQVPAIRLYADRNKLRETLFKLFLKCEFSFKEGTYGILNSVTGNDLLLKLNPHVSFKGIALAGVRTKLKLPACVQRLAYAIRWFIVSVNFRAGDIVRRYSEAMRKSIDPPVDSLLELTFNGNYVFRPPAFSISRSTKSANQNAVVDVCQSLLTDDFVPLRGDTNMLTNQFFDFLDPPSLRKPAVKKPFGRGIFGFRF